MTKIKICGLSRPCDIDYVNEAMPDYVGFVFAKSRRQVSAGEARALCRGLDKRIKAVGVFVNAPAAEIEALCEEGMIQVVQLHGGESAEYIDALRQKIDRPIIKAVSVTPGLALGKSGADYYLFDQGKGGTGVCFDWSMIPETEKPFFLAGGLTPENLGPAIRRVGPFGVDLSSGVETDGVKDKKKILEAVRRVRNEER